MDIRTILKLLWPVLICWTAAVLVSQAKVNGYEVYHIHHILVALGIIGFGVNIWRVQRKSK